MIQEQKEIEEKVLSLKLKVWYNDTSKDVSIRKNNTLKELSDAIIEIFELKDINLKNFRLRAYDSKLKANLAAYDSWDT